MQSLVLRALLACRGVSDVLMLAAAQRSLPKRWWGKHFPTFPWVTCPQYIALLLLTFCFLTGCPGEREEEHKGRKRLALPHVVQLRSQVSLNISACRARSPVPEGLC